MLVRRQYYINTLIRRCRLSYHISYTLIISCFIWKKRFSFSLLRWKLNYSDGFQFYDIKIKIYFYAFVGAFDWWLILRNRNFLCSSVSFHTFRYSKKIKMLLQLDLLALLHGDGFFYDSTFMITRLCLWNRSENISRF